MNPSRFVQSFDFSAFQETQPSTPLPGLQLDVQLADIQTSTTELRDAIMDIRRSDGALMNEIVTRDSLAPGLVDELSSETGAAESAASAAAAAASALEVELTANELEATLETLSASGGVSDWGTFDEEPFVSLDWGTF